VLLIGSARRGGAEGQLVRLAAELRQRGVDVRVVFSAGGGPLIDDLDAAGVPYKVLASGWHPNAIPNKILRLPRMAAYLAHSQPDVVFAWLAGVVWYALPLARALTRASRLAAFRGEIFDRDLRWLAAPFRHAVSHAHAVTINAPSLQREALRWGAVPDRIALIPNAVDTPLARADVVKQPPTAVVVANFRWYKGHDVLLEALTRVRSRLIVRLVGEGQLATEIRSRSHTLGVQHKVQIVGQPADVKRELAQAQFAVHPSRTEGLSNAILEQMAAGLPVVATEVGGNGLLVRHGVNGFLVPPGQPEALGQHIERMASDPQLRATMAAESLCHVKSFDWESCTFRYLTLLDRVSRDARSAT